MKAVIHTQIRENYGAHNWDGKGDCPQYWKFKGGRTLIIYNVTIENNMDRAWWQNVIELIEYKSESFEEYIVGETIVDDIDFDEADYVEEWDSPINLSFAEGRCLATRYTKAEILATGIVGRFEQWVQLKGGDQDEYTSLYELKDGTMVTYKEWLESQEVA